MGLRGLSLFLDGGRLSDLFFNHEHPERDKLYARAGDKGDKIDDGELERAIASDADEFLMTLGLDAAMRAEVGPELVADFNRRV